MTAPTISALRSLSDLVDTARVLATRARVAGANRAAHGLLGIARDLDSARTRLVEDGDGYLEAAWAFIDAGRRLIAGYRVQLNAERNGHHARA